jgi:hypothetical protein
MPASLQPRVKHNRKESLRTTSSGFSLSLNQKQHRKKHTRVAKYIPGSGENRVASFQQRNGSKGVSGGCGPHNRINSISFFHNSSIGIDLCRNARIHRAHHAGALLNRPEDGKRKMLPRFRSFAKPAIVREIGKKLWVQSPHLKLQALVCFLLRRAMALLRLLLQFAKLRSGATRMIQALLIVSNVRLHDAHCQSCRVPHYCIDVMHPEVTVQ